MNGFIDKNQAKGLVSIASRTENNFPRSPDAIRDLLEKKGFHFTTAEKIIFLGGENLETLTGYKASVQLTDGLNGTLELHIVITGFSACGGKAIFEALTAMKPEEIKGDNGDQTTAQPHRSGRWRPQ